MVQIMVPSRTDVKAYADLKQRIDQRVGDINGRYASAGCLPIQYFYRNLPAAQLYAHYRAADVFVFPSRTDTLGLVQLEALACGVPVAAYPVQGPLDVIGDSAAGALDEDLAVAIERALHIAPENCRARALEHSWDQSVVEFHANLIRIPTPSYHFRAEGETA